MKRSNWILLLLLAISIGVYFLLKAKADKNAAEETPTATSSLLINAAGDVLQSIRIYDKDYHIVELVRNENGLWTVSLPTAGEADQSLAGAAESQIGALGVTSQLGMVSNFGDFGLDFPAYTIKLTYYSGIQHKIEVGDLTPTNSGYYVQLDDGDVYVVSQYSLNAVLSLLQNPPYPPTPTPTQPPASEATPTP